MPLIILMLYFEVLKDKGRGIMTLITPFLSVPLNSEEYRCEDPPRVVLDKLEEQGYRVVCMTGVGQTCIWTLHKETKDKE